MQKSLIAKFALGIITMSICGCAAIQSDRNAQEEKRAQMVRRMDDAHVFVTSGDIPKEKPYKVLGDLKYSAPFSTDAIESAGIERKLKAMALAKYPDNADAVIKVSSDVDASGETVTITGEAVQFDTSADRDLMHNMWDQAVASPK